MCFAIHQSANFIENAMKRNKKLILIFPDRQLKENPYRFNMDFAICTRVFGIVCEIWPK